MHVCGSKKASRERERDEGIGGKQAQKRAGHSRWWSRLTRTAMLATVLSTLCESTTRQTSSVSIVIRDDMLQNRLVAYKCGKVQHDDNLHGTH